MQRAKCIIKGLIIMLVFMAAALISSKTEVRAASGVKLSKTSLTFASDKAKAQTVTIKNIKKSNIKSVKISYYSKTWIKIKKKNKNQLVITPKLSTGNNYGIVDIIVEFKKPIKKEYRAYLSIKSIKIKGKSQIPVKTADDFLKMTGNCDSNKWTYYLANDIDLTGKGYWHGRSSDNYIVFDGKDHKIISDGPAFESFSGKMKNVIFECNYDMKTSKNDVASSLLKESNAIAPVMEMNTLATMTHCKSTGSININFDTKTADAQNFYIAGLVSNNYYSTKVSQCKSDVDIRITVADTDYIHGLYVGGLVASNNNNAQITECEFSGSIYTDYRWPFLAGICVHNDNTGRISDCLNSGSVSSAVPYDYTAGICTSASESTGDGGIYRVLNTGSVRAALYGGLTDQDDLDYNQLPKFEYAYYLKSKSTAVLYRTDPIAIPGAIGITDDELIDQSVFAGFDFDKVWTMTAEGPRLKNVYE